MSAGVYAVYGLRVSSEIPLPELAGAGPVRRRGGSAAGRGPDVTIALGAIPAAACEPANADGYSIAADGIRFEVPGVARYLARGGAEILVDPEPGAASGVAGTERVRRFLLGSAMGALLHQRGLLPVHASVVRFGGRAVAFCADTGGGKSTLAAAFLRRGREVVCDDVGAVEMIGDGTPRVLPGVPRLRLTDEALAVLGGVPEGTGEHTAGGRKRALTGAGVGGREALELARVYCLEFCDGAAAPPAIDEVGPFEALVELRRHVYRPSLITGLERERQFFEWARRALGRIRVFRLTRRRDLDGLGETADLVEAHLGTPGDG